MSRFRCLSMLGRPSRRVCRICIVCVLGILALCYSGGYLKKIQSDISPNVSVHLDDTGTISVGPMSLVVALKTTQLFQANSTAIAASITPAAKQTITKVVVMAYYRGGSSFLANSLDVNSEAFYLFEPFASFSSMYKSKERLPIFGDIYVDKFTSTFRPMKPYMQDLIVQHAIDLLNCDFAKIPRSMLFHGFFTGPGFVKSPNIRSYRTCMTSGLHRPKGMSKTQFKILKRDHFGSVYNTCLKLLTQSCLQRTIRGFKTIRMTMEQVSLMLAKAPDIKVIYSTRDPRSIVSSRRKIDGGTRNRFSMHVSNTCVRIRHDLNYVERIKSDYPNNIFRTNYSSIYKDLRSTTSRIYTFLQRPMSDSLLRWVKLEEEKQKRRINDDRTAKWKKYFTLAEELKMNDTCHDLIVHIGQ